MKLKKSLLALTTAATVAVAGSTAAVAEDTTPDATPETAVTNEENGDDTVVSSADQFFGWKDDTSGLEKMKSVVTLITTIGALVAGIVTLAANFGKIQNLFK